MAAGTIALGTAVAGLFSATAVSTASAFVIGFATQTAIGLALYALSPKPKLSAGGGYLITGNGAALDHQIIYGRTKVAGVRVFDTTEGSNGNNKFLHRVIAFTGHEIESFEKIYIDNVEILSRDGDGNVTSIDADDSDRYDGFIDIHEHLGSPDQTVDSLLKLRVGDDVNAPDWGDNHRLRGVSYLYVRMKYNADVFPSGVPEITALIKGKKVYDPRTGTTAWSDNSALCTRDYISSEYGLGEESGSIDDTFVAAAADICDQSVTDANDSSVSPRYTCNGAFTTDQQPVDILEAMATSMAGILWYAQGQWRMKPGYWTPPTLSLDENDFIGPIKVNTRHSRRDNFNGVRGTYRGAASDYQQTDYPSVQDAGSLAADNDKESWADLNLTFTDTPQMAHRVARIALEQNRQQMIVQADFNLKAFKLQIGDVVNITNSRFGWSNKEFEVISWSFGVGENLAIPVTMTLRETAESIYDQVADGATYELDNTTLASPFTTQTPVLGSPVINKEVQEDGTTLISVDFSWSVTDASEIAYYDFEWKLGGASDYNSTTVSQTTFSLTGLNNQTTYDYRVRSINQLGIASPYASSSVSTGKDTTTPKAPTNVSVTGGYRLCTVRWDAPTQNTDNSTLFDLYQHKVYRGATSGFTPNDSTNLVGIVSADYFNDGGLDNNTTYHYKVKAIDYSGNESAASGSGSGTTQADISSDTQDLIDNAGVQTVDTSTATGAYNGQFVIDSTDGNLYIWDAVLGDWVPAVEKVDLTGAVDVADFAAGLTPIEIVSSLPATGDFVGQTVYLTSDKKTYTWNGTEWVTGVNAEDIIGTIDGASQVDLTGAVDVADFAAGIAPPTIVTSLPASGDYQGQLVFLTSDNKLYRWTGSEWTVEVDGEDIVANSITAGQIAVGAIGADQIAANAITTEKLAVGDFSSKVTNYTFSNSGEGWKDIAGDPINESSDFAIVLADTGSGTIAIATMPTPQALRANVDASGLITNYPMSTPVVPGEKYLLSFDYAGVGTSISRTWRVQVYFRDTEGNFLSVETNDQTVTTTTWTETTREITVPSGAAEIYLVRIMAVASGSSNQIYITNVRLRNISSGVLIEDGSITANKIVAGGIDAQDIIATGTITATQIDALGINAEDLITTGTITAPLIETGAIGADQIAANAITTEKLAIGNFSSIVTNYAFTKKAETIIAEGWSYSNTEFEVIDFNSGSVTNAIATMPTPQSIRAILPNTQVDCDFSVEYTTFPGEEFVVSFDYAGQGSIASDTRTVSVLLFFDDADGTLISAPSNGVTVSSTTWASTSFKITAPAGAAKLDLIRLRAGSDSAENVYITNLKVRQVTTGVLIEDGSITANKIVAGGIDAEDLIVNGTITGALIQAETIEGSKIKIDGVTLDTDGSDNLIISTNGVDFTQLAANSATDVEYVGTSFTGAGPHTYEPTLTMDHEGDLILIARFSCFGAYGSGDNVTAKIIASGLTLDSYSITGSAPGTIVLMTTVEYSSGTFPLSLTNYDFEITSSGVTSPEFDIDVMAIKRYR